MAIRDVKLEIAKISTAPGAKEAKFRGSRECHSIGMVNGKGLGGEWQDNDIEDELFEKGAADDDDDEHTTTTTTMTTIRCSIELELDCTELLLPGLVTVRPTNPILRLQ